MKYSQLKLSICILLTLVNLIVFWQVQSHDFLNFDDDLYILNNQNVNTGLNSENFAWSFKTIHGGFWFPLTWLSHMMDCELYGLNPTGHHLNNLLFHIINTILLFLVLNKISGKLWRSAFVATLFAIHPLHVEPVAWIASRKDVLSTLFWMLVIWSYINYTARPSFKRYLPVILFFTMGLMSKPMLITLPFILLLLDYWPIGRMQFDNRRQGAINGSDSKPLDKHKNPSLGFLILEKLPLLIIAVIAGLFVFYTERKAGALPTFEACPLNMRLANAVVSYSAYILKMFWPQHLSVYYLLRGTPPWWQIASSAALLIIISIFALRFRLRHPYLLVGWLWYLITLLPVIGIIQIGSHAMADRYTYVPLIGLFIMITWLTADIIDKWRIPRPVYSSISVFLLLTLMYSSVFQVRYWKNGLTLFRHAIKLNNSNHLMYYSLGYEMFKKGDLEKAILYFSRAADLNHDYYQAYNNLGVALAAKDRVDEAVKNFMRAIQIKPDYIEAYNNLSNALKLQGRSDDAILKLVEAVEIQPENPETHYNLGVLYVKKNQIDKAISHFTRAIEIKDDYAEAFNNMGFAYAKKGEFNKAVKYLSEAVAKKGDYAEAYYNLGFLFSQQGNFSEAKKYYERAVQLKPDYKEADTNLKNIIKKLNSE